MAFLLQPGNSIARGALLPAPPGAVPPFWARSICPNFEDWMPGDVVLVHQGPDLQGSLLAAGQQLTLMARGRAAQAHHTVTHAAIYVGQGMLVDAVPKKGVQLASVWDYAETRMLQLRRLTAISDQLRADAAAYALSRVGKTFNMRAIVFGEKRGDRPGENLDSYYCSQLVLEAYADAASVDLSDKPEYKPFFPPMMVAHPVLKPVPLRWWQCWGANLNVVPVMGALLMP